MLDIKMIENELKEFEVLEKSYKDRKEFLENELRSLDIELADYTTIKDVFLKVMEKQRDELKKKIETLITFGLQDIFETDIKFKIEFSVKRNKLWAEFYIDNNGNREKLENQGGGVINVVSFLLRVIFIKLLGLEPILILDEAFSMVSANYRERLVNFVKRVSDDLDIQLIIVTHLEEFKEIADVMVKTDNA